MYQFNLVFFINQTTIICHLLISFIIAQTHMAYNAMLEVGYVPKHNAELTLKSKSLKPVTPGWSFTQYRLRL